MKSLVQTLLSCAGMLAGACSGAAAAPLPVPDEPLLGQAFPGGSVVLQRADGTAGPRWPAELAFAPLELGDRAGATHSGVARWRNLMAAAYVPEWAGMPVAAASPCTARGYRPLNGQHYAAGLRVVDYFGRGAPDHCVRDEGLALYQAVSRPGASYPVVAWPGRALEPDFTLAGKPRPLANGELVQVQTFEATFRAEYRQAYGREPDEGVDAPGRVPTLADARILLEARAGNTPFVLRVSQWERLTVRGEHFQVMVVDVFEAGRMVGMHEFTRALGVPH